MSHEKQEKYSPKFLKVCCLSILELTKSKYFFDKPIFPSSLLLVICNERYVNLAPAMGICKER